MLRISALAVASAGAGELRSAGRELSKSSVGTRANARRSKAVSKAAADDLAVDDARACAQADPDRLQRKPFHLGTFRPELARQRAAPAVRYCDTGRPFSTAPTAPKPAALLDSAHWGCLASAFLHLEPRPRAASLRGDCFTVPANPHTPRQPL